MFGPPELSWAPEDADKKNIATKRAGSSLFEQIIQHRQRLETWRNVTAWIIEMGDVIRRGTVRQSPTGLTPFGGCRDF
jgi:hypothetical protein